MSFVSSHMPVTDQLRRMVDDTDAFLRQVFVPGTSNIQFQVEGVFFQARYSSHNDGIKLQFWAELGYLPYSVESVTRRHLLITVLESTRFFTQAHFGITHEHEIVVTHTIDVPTIQPPAYVFVPLMSFLQETLPYIRLIGECLQEE